MAKETKALAKIEGPVEEALQKYDPSRYNLLTPITSIDRLPEMSRLSVRVVPVDTSDGGGDCYHSKLFMKSNERAPTKVLLDKIAAAAGITWIQSRRIDDRSDPYLCEWEAIAEMVDFDGTKRRIIRSKGVDLRDGAPAVQGMSPGMLKQQRTDIATLAESKTCNRVIRSALAMKQKYTAEELKRPFVIPRLVPDMDMTDPVVKEAVIQHRLGAERQLFGPASGPVIDVDPEVHTPELLSPGEDVDEPVSQPDSSPSSDSFPGDVQEESDHPTVVCACTKCDDGGCQVDLSDLPKVVEWTMRECGMPLCSACCPPSKGYDAEKHEAEDV